MKMEVKHVRWMVLAAVFSIIAVGLTFNTDLGTLSSFGWQAIASICPLGSLESMLAPLTVFPRALIVLAVTVIVVIILGKVFCAWICPVAPISSLIEMARGKFSRFRKPLQASRQGREPIGSGREKGLSQNVGVEDSLAEGGLGHGTGTKDSLVEGSCSRHCFACANKTTQEDQGGKEGQMEQSGQTAQADKMDGSNLATNQASRPKKGSKFDSRHVILGGTLLSAALLGFPVFCLVCPIGLIFGTVIVIWHLIGYGTASISLLIFPLLLIVELLVLRKWCGRFCPLGALLSLLSLPNRFVRPVVDRRKCLRFSGGKCTVCSDVCREQLDPHYATSLNECTKCGLCKDKCPAGAIGFSMLPKKGAYLDEDAELALIEVTDDTQPRSYVDDRDFTGFEDDPSRGKQG